MMMIIIITMPKLSTILGSPANGSLNISQEESVYRGNDGTSEVFSTYSIYDE